MQEDDQLHHKTENKGRLTFILVHRLRFYVFFRDENFSSREEKTRTMGVYYFLRRDLFLSVV